jgi:hypothetical protein
MAVQLTSSATVHTNHPCLPTPFKKHPFMTEKEIPVHCQRQEIPDVRTPNATTHLASCFSSSAASRRKRWCARSTSSSVMVVDKAASAAAPPPPLPPPSDECGPSAVFKACMGVPVAAVAAGTVEPQAYSVQALTDAYEYSSSSSSSIWHGWPVGDGGGV